MSEPRNRHGLSLVEILVAVGILAVIMLPVALSFSAGSRGIQMTSEEFTAHAIGLELMEQLMAAPFSLLVPGSYPDSALRDGQPLAAGSPLILHLSPSTEFERRLAISEIKKGPTVRFKKIEITVDWKAREGVAKRSFNLKSLYANEN